LSEQYRVPNLLFGAIVAATAIFGTGATCADSSALNDGIEPASCVVDGECLPEEVCFRGACELNCVVDDDCGAGEVCRAELRADMDDVVDVCVIDDSQNGGTMECTSDEECRETNGPLAECGIDGVCFVPELEHALLIRDTTTEPTDEDGGLGADIAAVYLQDENGVPVAWAETLDLVPANDVAPTNAPAGKSVPLSLDGMCVEGDFDTAATPLGGEDGFLLVRFLEVTTERIVTTQPDTWNVVVVEWGDNCGATGEQDTYEVLGCAAPSHKALDPDTHCGPMPLHDEPASGRLVLDAGEK
jgi:hypothetical protein